MELNVVDSFSVLEVIGLETELNLVDLLLVLRHNGFGTWALTLFTISSFWDVMGLEPKLNFVELAFFLFIILCFGMQWVLYRSYSWLTLRWFAA